MLGVACCPACGEYTDGCGTFPYGQKRRARRIAHAQQKAVEADARFENRPAMQKIRFWAEIIVIVFLLPILFVVVLALYYHFFVERR